jgi:hypothetical protein
MASVAGWTCAQCGRQFGRRNQSHECAPAICFIDLRDPADVDEDVRDWLTEAYLSSPV